MAKRAGAYTETNVEGPNMRVAPNIFLPPPRSSWGRGQNLNCKFKTFGFLDTLKVHIVHTVQLPYKYYLISPSNKTSRKKTAN